MEGGLDNDSPAVLVLHEELKSWSPDDVRRPATSNRGQRRRAPQVVQGGGKVFSVWHGDGAAVQLALLVVGGLRCWLLIASARSSFFSV